jgi:RND family efflux transporter MFP subunit
MTHNGVLAWFVLLVVGGALLGCGKEPAAPASEPVRPIKIGTVGVAEFGARPEFPGVLSSAQQAQVAFEVAGRLVELNVIEGQAAKAGDVLAKLDPRDFQSALDAVKARADNAESQYRRVQELVERGVASQQEGDNVRQTLDVARADLQRAQKALEDSELRAPFDGQVAVVHVENFQNVQAKQPIIDLVDVDSLEIKIDVPENLIARTAPNLTVEERDQIIQAEVTVSGLEGRRFKARLKEFSQTADPATRTYRATFAFDKPDDANVLPGMTARLMASPPIPDGETVRIPVSAIKADASGQSMVWVVNSDMTAESRPVELGEMRGDTIAVLSGLARGERIALSGVHQLREGMAVEEFGG